MGNAQWFSLAGFQPEDHCIELADHEIQGQSLHVSLGPGEFGLQSLAVFLAGCQLTGDDGIGGDIQQAGDVKTAEEEHPDAVNADRRVRIVQPIHQTLLAAVGKGVFRAGGRVRAGENAAGDQAGFLQTLEYGVKLAGAHLPDPPEMLGGTEPFEQFVSVGGLGVEQAKQDFIGCEAFHLPILSWNRFDWGWRRVNCEWEE